MLLLFLVTHLSTESDVTDIPMSAAECTANVYIDENTSAASNAPTPAAPATAAKTMPLPLPDALPPDNAAGAADTTDAADSPGAVAGPNSTDECEAGEGQDVTDGPGGAEAAANAELPGEPSIAVHLATTAMAFCADKVRALCIVRVPRCTTLAHFLRQPEVRTLHCQHTVAHDLCLLLAHQA